MHGIVRKNQVNRFKNKLSEGSVFIIKNFKVVESIGDVISPNKNGELINMDIIFIDENVLSPLGNLMHGMTRKNQVNRFKDKLRKDSVFITKNLKVVESIGECH
ncbi:hypothetical protein H5410_037358 [Solanum commersonii]|uniref:Uncharacterized protein n=1 Tax=Solanum commersonii TaxID=4109 RepID=A0A9J5YB01_SOLCO|nr:hypothetical protein H5410_037358 [Solanum commersonii]